MYLQQQELNILQDIKQQCKKREGRFVKSKNNKWIYIPSKEYMEMKEKMSQSVNSLQVRRENMIEGVKEACNKLSRIHKAMDVATSRGKRVSHIENGTIILV